MREDDSARTQAIDPSHSFIVQAPAGSGKTELLTQRFLKLLSCACKNPEEIIAITFTRKAANEMRERIYQALLNAQQPEPIECHKKTTWQLAKSVLIANDKYHWNLLQNPNRLRILTIDALSGLLNSQIPLLSAFGANPTIADEPTRYYENAILDLLNNPGELKPYVSTLLMHVENKATTLITLLTRLLQCREQWLPNILGSYAKSDKLKTLLETGLSNLVTEKIQQADQLIPVNYRNEIVELISYAKIPLIDFPDANSNYLFEWQALAELFITKQLTWRKMVDKRCGFPTSNKSMKKSMLDLLAELQTIPGLEQSLIEILLCPPIHYTQIQWHIISALLHILPTLTALLHIQFRNAGVVDFVELTLGALRALGNQEQPTDLALYLDYQIKHLLIDEFQDTSVIQLNLLQTLTAEWQPNEGKTLFLVGDPMQSIYRFRNAEVGLFLRTQKHGIANIQPKPLILRSNFRSNDAIVHWVNNSFPSIFPAIDNFTYGAVTFNYSQPTHPNSDAAGVYFYASRYENFIKTIQSIDRTESIAILVRSRRHLAELIPLLNQEKINYQAVELETLDQRTEIIDLLSLTKALLHPADRIAWLAILRAPWCGLKLHDLHAITEHAGDKPLWSSLIQYNSIANLSHDAKTRLECLIPILAHSLNGAGRIPLSSWVKGTWLALNGMCCLQDENQYQNTLCFFELLEQIENEFSFNLLESKLKKLFSKPINSENCNLHLMTIHKSKGLEFDHVIIPELQANPPANPNELLMWLEHPNQNDETDLILAPIKSAENDHDPIHRYLKHIESQKLNLEYARLLYVACTRAKKTLHLMAKLKVDEKTGEFKAPLKGSFLHLLWPQYQDKFIADFSAQEESVAQQSISSSFKRLINPPSPDFSFPPPIDVTGDKNHPVIDSDNQKLASLTGTLIHEALAKNLMQAPITYWQQRLIQLNIHSDNQKLIIERIQNALAKIHDDSMGQWILHNHFEARNEYPITCYQNGKFIYQVIDRTFIDDNKRWIIDYKTSTPNDEALDVFLQQQKLIYSKQLDAYAKTFSLLESKEIKLGLYFPLCQGWICWDFQSKTIFESV